MWMVDPRLLERFGRDPAGAKAALGREFAAFEALPAALADGWFVPRAPGAWSAAQTTEHVLKTNVRMSKTLRLLRQNGPLPEPSRTPGTLKDGKPQAPVLSLPGDGLAWAALEPGWLEMREQFLAELEATQTWRGQTRFHPFFGDLDALGWVRAAALHMAHHRRQLAALR